MIKYHRAQIREFFGFRENTVQDSQEMPEWLCQHVLHRSQEWEHIKESVYGRGIMGFNNSALAPLLDLTTIILLTFRPTMPLLLFIISLTRRKTH
ncbi:hypothetical protein [Paenibacillus polymyxa]|uniref:hypothetical protein n=1 Tax=Paenibacillus polymyxa TaxID=1406 RepID=UPI0032AF1241